MWPACLNHLTPFVCEIKPYIPEFLEEDWDAVKQISEYKVPFPVRLVSLLGHWATSAYPDCPTLPEHHVINSRLYAKTLQEYLNYVGERFHREKVITLFRQGCDVNSIANQICFSVPEISELTKHLPRSHHSAPAST